jgi:chromosome segregation ATPase
MSSIVSSGAAAILEKYAALNNGIDECRRDAIHISAQLEAIRMEIADLAFKCDEMNDQMEQTKFEKKQLENELKEAKLKRSNLERSKEDALAAYDKAKRELQFAQSLREEDRLQFMGECKKYREACKRIRLSALVAAGSSGAGEGIVHNSHAFHILPPEIDECSYCSDDESPSLQETFPHIEYTNERDSHHDDASTMSESVLNAVNSPNPQPVKRKTLNKAQKMEEKDPEIKVAKDKEAHALNQFLQAKRELDQAIAERDERSLKAEDRMDKLEQQQAQLERIKTDVESMEMELIALERNSKEARLMSEGFAKGTFLWKLRRRTKRLAILITMFLLALYRH